MTSPTLIPAKLRPYAKTVTAVVTGAIGWGATVVASEPAPVTASEWIGLATVLAIALGVFRTSND